MEKTDLVPRNDGNRPNDELRTRIRTYLLTHKALLDVKDVSGKYPSYRSVGEACECHRSVAQKEWDKMADDDEVPQNHFRRK